MATTYSVGPVTTVAGNKRIEIGRVLTDATASEFETHLSRIEGAIMVGVNTGDNQLTLNINSKTTTSDNDGNGGWIDHAASGSGALYHVLVTGV